MEGYNYVSLLPELETIDRPPSASMRCSRSAGRGFPYVWHFHPEVELTLILSSEGHRFVGDSIESFAPGDLVLLGPHLPHTWHSFVAESESSPVYAESVVVQFRQDIGGLDWLDLPEAAGVRHLLGRARRGLAFPPGYRGIDRSLIRLAELDGWTQLIGLLDILGQLAADPDAGRLLSGSGHALPPRLDDQHRIDRICRRLAESYTQPITQAQAADDEHMSPSSFSRFFKRMTDRTFVGYLHELRVADACRRLAHPEASITDIAFDCGFANVSNFNRVFRRLRGASPREIRQRLMATQRDAP